jgi:catalase
MEKMMSPKSSKGAGAYGIFTVTQDITPFTGARLFDQMDNETQVLVRFSTVAGEPGFADTLRDPCGFAVKFYTEEGHWDLVGNNTPVFFVRDPVKLRDFIHSRQRDPATGRRSATRQWDFWSLTPESLHQVTLLFGDRGIPASFRHMHCFSSHTHSLRNGRGERFWVKWHFKTLQGIRYFTEEQACRIAGEAPDLHRQDLRDAIAKTDYPKWTLYVQVMPEQEADTWRRRTGWNPFDLTKVWPHKHYPLREVGVLELNRNPEDDVAEVEQTALEPGSLPPGIGGPVGDDHRAGNDYYGQAGNLFRLMCADAKARLIGNIVTAMNAVPREIQLRQIGHLLRADRAYGEGLASQLGITLADSPGVEEASSGA